MNSVGTILRTERERQGRQVPEIAGELCITQRYLRAIEEDDLKSLPGAFFYKSFVKQYAALLHLDDTQFHSDMDALTATLEPVPLPGADRRYAQPEAGAPKPIRDLDPIVRDGNRSYFQDSRMGLSVAGLVGVLLACSFVYSWYNRPPQSLAAQAPSSSQTQITAVKVDSAQADKPKVDVSATTDSENHVVLNLSATEPTWISITADGKQIFSGVLEPSQTKTLSGLEVAKMRVGNAGGLDVRWNGKSIGPIGPRGQVRVVTFTPENFQILQPGEPM
jgi:cytoskeletal protein RodZ